MAPWTLDGTRSPDSIFEAAAYHVNIRVACKCGHSACYEAHCLWWLFERRGWNDALWEARKRFYCKPCQHRTGRKVRPAIVEPSKEVVTVSLPWPDERRWKRAQRRVR